MSQHDVVELPQRIAIVLEHDAESEDGVWTVVSYLISDTGRRERATLKATSDRVSAGEALKEVWRDMCRRR